MTVTEAKIKEFSKQFWETNSKLKKITELRLSQWTIEVLPSWAENYYNENEVLEFLKKREDILEDSISCICLLGKDIDNMHENLQFLWLHNQIKAYEIEATQAYYFVIYALKKDGNVSN
jgi:hypothetical protein